MPMHTHFINISTPKMNCELESDLFLKSRYLESIISQLNIKSNTTHLCLFY